jgi:ribosomal protein L37AE/L43A/transposase
MNMERKNFTKLCPSCGGIQTYTTKNRLQTSIRENWVCSKCSSTHKKKTYDSDVIDDVVKQYEDGGCVSKIASNLKICKRNIKIILIEKNVWVDKRDDIRKPFNEDEINDIICKYINERMGCETISKIYNVSRTPILRILKERGLLREGVSDGKKIELTEEQTNEIKKMYVEEYKSSEEISKVMNLGKPFVNKFLTKSGFRRNKSEGASVGLVKRFRKSTYNDYINRLSDFKKYKREVINLTKKQPIYELPNFNKRGVSGVEGNYHLDHKFSIVEGFIQNINPNIIGNIKNLEFIPWEENVKKRTNCSINITELIN